MDPPLEPGAEKQAADKAYVAALLAVADTLDWRAEIAKRDGRAKDATDLRKQAADKRREAEAAAAELVPRPATSEG
jgi:hypothetical protein